MTGEVVKVLVAMGADLLPAVGIEWYLSLLSQLSRFRVRRIHPASDVIASPLLSCNLIALVVKLLY